LQAWIAEAIAHLEKHWQYNQQINECSKRRQYDRRRRRQEVPHLLFGNSPFQEQSKKLDHYKVCANLLSYQG